jgi:hypothetical protein
MKRKRVSAAGVRAGVLSATGGSRHGGVTHTLKSPANSRRFSAMSNRLLSHLSFVLPLLVTPLTSWAQQRLPIIDMHLHAYAADENGPPPLGLCIPRLPHVPPLDPGRDVFNTLPKKPGCADPIWSPPTDAAVMEQTIAVLERRNIIAHAAGGQGRIDCAKIVEGGLNVEPADICGLLSCAETVSRHSCTVLHRRAFVATGAPTNRLMRLMLGVSVTNFQAASQLRRL